MKPTKDQIAMAVEAIVGEEATTTSGYYSASYRIDSEHAPGIASAALEVVLTDIEKRIEALRIDAIERNQVAWVDSEWLEGKADGLQDAIDILRGES